MTPLEPPVGCVLWFFPPRRGGHGGLLRSKLCRGLVAARSRHQVTPSASRAAGLSPGVPMTLHELGNDIVLGFAPIPRAGPPGEEECAHQAEGWALSEVGPLSGPRFAGRCRVSCAEWERV